MAAYRVVESGGSLSSEQFCSEQLPERKTVSENIEIYPPYIQSITQQSHHLKTNKVDKTSLIRYRQIITVRQYRENLSHIFPWIPQKC